VAAAKPARAPWGLLAACLAVYTLTSYGGTRSPDSEVVVRTAEALVDHGSFAVDADLETWPGFGLATGRDGGRYAIFGPLEPVLLVPFVALAHAVDRTGWYQGRDLPLSHYVGVAAFDILRGQRPDDLEPHAVRMICALFGVLVGVACVWAMFALVLAFTGDRRIGLLAGFLLGFGTPLWSYSGTLFSEPLAMLLAILSLRFLVGGPWRRRPLAGGALLGLATTAHLTAVLFAPFFALYLVLEPGEPAADRGRRWIEVAWFAAGVAAFLVLLGVYDWARFGDPLETGRGVADELGRPTLYGHFTWPWAGLRGLLVSPGKSLLVYVPAVAIAGALWPHLHRRHRALSLAIAGAALFRLLFVACRSDWHGGWALGPRYLILLTPFLLLPIAAWLRDRLAAPGTLRVAFLLCFASAAQQLYFAVGEPFTLNRIAVTLARARGDSFDLNYELGFTPLGASLDSGPGPYLLGRLPLSTAGLWLLGTAVLAAALALWWRRLSGAPDIGRPDGGQVAG